MSVVFHVLQQCGRFEGRTSGLWRPCSRVIPLTKSCRVCGQGGGGNPLEWLAKLNPFDKRRRDEEDELRGRREWYQAVPNSRWSYTLHGGINFGNPGYTL